MKETKIKGEVIVRMLSEKQVKGKIKRNCADGKFELVAWAVGKHAA